MAIKFVPSDKGVKLEDRDGHDKQVLSLLKYLANKLNRLELQLEKLTDQEIDPDDGDIL
jgi:hypothetical protein